MTYDEVIEAGEHLPGMAALWDVETIEERYEMVTILLEPGGLYYDLENKIVAAIKPRPAFLPVLRMLNGVMEFDETRGLLVTEHWCERNRRASDYPQDAQRDRQHDLPVRLQSAWLFSCCVSFFKTDGPSSHNSCTTTGITWKGDGKWHHYSSHTKGVK